ncbi:MAG: GNAT family N-acetyltransferase [Hungatella sp.]|nr:GNAT family N-acetyltransferase [Hungatella sp.]
MTLETKRLYLLSPAGADPQRVADYLRRNREFMECFEPAREEKYYSRSFQEEALRQQAKDWEDGKGYRFYISPKEDEGLIIGFAALNNVVMGPFCSCFMGYQLDKDYLRRGLMTETVNEVVRYAFESLGLHRIEGNIMPRNKASIGVVEKCGFVNEGTSRKYLKINGVWEDHIHFVKINEAME